MDACAVEDAETEARAECEAEITSLRSRVEALTAELEKAKAIPERWRAVPEVAQALRDVERETLERAAKVAEDFDWRKTVNYDIPHRIRSLLQKE